MSVPPGEAPSNSTPPEGVPVLLVIPDPGQRLEAREALAGAVSAVEARGVPEAAAGLAPGGVGVIVTAGPDAGAVERLCAGLAEALPGAAVVALVPRDSASCAARCVRAGAADVVPWPESAAGELAGRVGALIGLLGERACPGEGDAARRGARGTIGDEVASWRRARLERLTGGLAAGADHAGAGGVSAHEAYEALGAPGGADRASAGASPSGWDELGDRLRQELDVDGLLRTLLEALLARVGSTNAAIYFPSPSDMAGVGSDWSLAAYINYDLARDHAEVMLDQLATFVPGAIAQAEGLVRVSDEESEAAFGDEAHWLAGQDSVLAPAIDPDPTGPAGEDGAAVSERLAVVHLFRDPAMRFSRGDEASLLTAARLLGEQMARIIRVHHRTSAGPGASGGELFDGFDTGSDETEDDLGFAA